MSVQTPVEFVEIGKIMLFDGETTMPWSRFNHPAIVVIDLPVVHSFGLIGGFEDVRENSDAIKSQYR